MHRLPRPKAARSTAHSAYPAHSAHDTRSMTRTALASVVTGLVTSLVTGLALTPAAHAGNPATPRNFTGYGFDQCLAPSQKAMNTWLTTSPYWGVGIYISGDSRACRSQPNLTPRWVSTQLHKGWRLLPITLGPQAACNPRFPRYGDDETIDDYPGRYGNYSRASNQGYAEGSSTVNDAKALGIRPGSTLWYDIEAFDTSDTTCRESALRFLSSWTRKVHRLGYVAGVYSSAASGIKMLDDAKAGGRDFHYPDYIWIARWDGKANTSTTYIPDTRWNPHRRVKQYQGGHNETWGGVTINIDRDYLDVGRGSVAPTAVQHCGGVNINFWEYGELRPGSAPPKWVKALQCLLREKGLYSGDITGRYNTRTINAANAWQRKIGLPVSSTWKVHHWVTLLTAGSRPVVKIGSASAAVRRLQRALNAALDSPNLTVTGVFNSTTGTALRTWQDRADLPVTGVAAWNTWRRMQN